MFTRTHLIVLCLSAALLAACGPASPSRHEQAGLSTPAEMPEKTPTKHPPLIPGLGDCSNPGETIELRQHSQIRGYEERFAVHLPPCYHPESENGYPVIYLLPGRGSSYQAWLGAAEAAQTADELILDGEVPPFILVFSDNISVDTTGSTVVLELAPFIETNYRASQDRRHRVAAGGSLGGIAAYRIVFNHPERFASAGLFGSGALQGEEEQIRAWLGKTSEETRPRVFFNTGSEDVLMLPTAWTMIGLLDEAGIEHTEVFGEGGHDYQTWGSNLPAFFRWAAQVW